MTTNSISFKFEELKVYQRSIEYVEYINKLIKQFPEDEKYALTSQLRRAVYSIMLNIAEGSVGTKAQFIRYLTTARGSLYECIVCLTIAKRNRYINDNEETKIRFDSQEISKMLSGLVTYLKK